MIELIHGDCMEYLAKYGDKAYDLAIVDNKALFIYTMSIRKDGIYGD